MLDRNDKETDRLLDDDELGKRLRNSKSTRAKWRMDGGDKHPPYLKIGKKIFVRESDYERWLATKIRTSTSDPGDIPEELDELDDLGDFDDDFDEPSVQADRQTSQLTAAERLARDDR